MAINVKKYTKDQMAKMVEDAQAENAELERQVAALGDRIDKQNDALSEYANRNMNLKSDISALRVKLKDTEDALGRANADAAQQTSFAEYRKREYDAMVEMYKTAALEEWRAKTHPWRNLWAWFKRKAARHE